MKVGTTRAFKNFKTTRMSESQARTHRPVLMNCSVGEKFQTAKIIMKDCNTSKLDARNRHLEYFIKGHLFL
ncbi:hypothetical protein RRG08_000721 [Elysia crispata]|uniref:Uncharacterized protein n=1 Tax=Elysia crispata TaxID=231223 RepID=A0AAE1AWM9_9GAST|nr:hypothetical protein RRG08_000721 [Elysia crispata]